MNDYGQYHINNEGNGHVVASHMRSLSYLMHPWIARGIYELWAET